MIPVSAVAVLLAWLLMQQAWLPAPAWLVPLSPLLLLGAWALGGLRALLPVLVLVWVCLSSHAILGDRLSANRVGEDVLLRVTVCDFPRGSGGVPRFEVDTGDDGRFHGLPRRLLVGWYESGPPPAIGEHWQLKLRLRGARGLLNEAGFDFERWLFARRIGGTAYVRTSALNQPLDSAGAAATCRLARWRGRVAAAVDAALADHPAAAYLLGLAVGARHGLEPADWTLLRRTGTSHLMAISGLHVGLVAALAGMPGLAVGRLLLRLGWRLPARLPAIITGLGAASLYAALAGFAIPTVRALAMLWTAGLLFAWRRSPGAGNCLAVAALLVLVIDPLAVIQPGFWLSFAGVAICLAALNWSAPAPGGQPWWQQPGRKLRALLLLQCLLGAGLAPLTILFFGEVPLVSVPANLLAVPVFSLLLVPLVLGGTALLFVWPGAGTFLLGLAAELLLPLLAVLGWLAAVPGGVLELVFAGTGARLLAIVAVVVLVWPPPLPGRLPAALLLLIACLAAPARPVAGGLAVEVLDVGQGLAVIVRTQRHTLVYDTGPAGLASDSGERVLVPVLARLRTGPPAKLVISHGHMDHLGGAASLLAAWPRTPLLAPQTFGLPVTDFRRCRAGLRWHWDGVDFHVLHPDEARIPWSLNDGSCVLLVTYAGGSLLLPGDIERLAESYLLRQQRLGQVDVLIAPHHGSRTSSTAGFVQATAPRHVVVSAGAFNQFGHPHEDPIRRWEEGGACVLNTARDGAVRFMAGPGEQLKLRSRSRVQQRRLWTATDPGPSECAGAML